MQDPFLPAGCTQDEIDRLINGEYPEMEPEIVVPYDPYDPLVMTDEECPF